MTTVIAWLSSGVTLDATEITNSQLGLATVRDRETGYKRLHLRQESVEILQIAGQANAGGRRLQRDPYRCEARQRRNLDRLWPANDAPSATSRDQHEGAILSQTDPKRRPPKPAGT